MLILDLMYQSHNVIAIIVIIVHCHYDHILLCAGTEYDILYCQHFIVTPVYLSEHIT